MKRTLAVILVIAGPVLVVLGLIISSPDGMAAKYGAIFGGLFLAVVGVALYRSTVKPEPIRRSRNYKEPAKLDLDGPTGSASGNAPLDSGVVEPKPSKSKRYEL